MNTKMLVDRLAELTAWHREQLAELEREQDGEGWAEFHRDAVDLLQQLAK